MVNRRDFEVRRSTHKNLSVRLSSRETIRERTIQQPDGQAGRILPKRKFSVV